MGQWSSRAARWRASQMYASRQVFFKNVLSRTDGVFDRYMNRRKGAPVTTVLWGRVFLAALILAGLGFLLRKVLS